MDHQTRTRIENQQHRWLTALASGRSYPYAAVCAGVEDSARAKLAGHVRRQLAAHFPVIAAVASIDVAAALLALARLGKTRAARESIDGLFRVLRPRLRRGPRGATLDRLLCLEHAIARARVSRGAQIGAATLARRLAEPRPMDRGTIHIVHVSRALVAWYAADRTTLPPSIRGRAVAVAVYKDRRSQLVRIAMT